MLLMLAVSACHTYLFQSVKKQITGKWLLSDSDTAKKETWEFRSDGTLEIRITNATQTDSIQWFTDPSSGVAQPYIEWSVENKITKHYLYTDAWWGTSNQDDIGRWLVVKVNKKKLYLSSEHQKKIRGSFQRGFIKQ